MGQPAVLAGDNRQGGGRQASLLHNSNLPQYWQINPFLQSVQSSPKFWSVLRATYMSSIFMNQIFCKLSLVVRALSMAAFCSSTDGDPRLRTRATGTMADVSREALFQDPEAIMKAQRKVSLCTAGCYCSLHGNPVIVTVLQDFDA